MEDITIVFTKREIQEILKDRMKESIERALEKNKDTLNNIVLKAFTSSEFESRSSNFERALDYAIEDSFRKALEKVMQELNFEELIASKAREILSSDDFIRKIAEEKIRFALNL